LLTLAVVVVGLLVELGGVWAIRRVVQETHELQHSFLEFPKGHSKNKVCVNP
jgi:hypothetical protein